MATQGYKFVYDEHRRRRVKRACLSCQAKKVSLPDVFASRETIDSARVLERLVHV
jgi:hypothetical protein